MAIDLNALSAREAITAIYIGYYDRAPDPEGIAFWEDVINMTSLDLVAITTDFAGQTETQAVYPFFADTSSSSASATITQIYLNLFNREPDDAGLAFWSNELEAAVSGSRSADDPNPDNPILSVGQIITSIIEGAQSLADGGFPDEEIILNKVEVALDWVASAEASDIDFANNTAAQNSAATILDGVTDQQSTVAAALAATDDFFAEDGNNGGLEGQEFDLGFGSFDPITGAVSGFDDLTGTAGADVFHAESGTLISGDQIDGGAGRDALTAFFQGEAFNGAPVSARTENLESVYVTNQTTDITNGDNNIEGFGQNVEIDGGRMVGVDRWETYDSRADLLIEDARDDDDTDGTFTGGITVAMVSTDPGNVDFAVYFDGPVNTAANNDSIFIEVIDQNNSSAFNAAAITNTTTGNLTDAQLTTFNILVDGELVTIDLDTDIVGTAHFGADATYQDLLNAINTRMSDETINPIILSDGTLLGDDLTATLGGVFDENIGDDNAGEATNTDVFGLQIVIQSSTGRELGDAGAGDITVISRNDPADTAQAITNQDVVIEELIRLNVELDDVGKGSMGGDAMFGAMSVGRQLGDDRTSDSIGIQQFDIEVDRSSQLQTINYTNNSLEVVNIQNGENSGINNTTTAADEMAGDLVVRGQANPGSTINDNGTATDTTDDFLVAGTVGGTNDTFPGAAPQMNTYGFSDVRVINAAAMSGALDLTAELTEETVEKYLEIQDGNSNGELDDVDFTYTLGNNADEFLLNMSNAALNQAGTGSREDFDMSISGGAGNDVITTNVGSTIKYIDEQGNDTYELFTDTGLAVWYQNSVFSNASTFTVIGGTGDDTIWTHGWGDTAITDGSGSDTVYTDNSGTVELFTFLGNIQANLLEDDPIDYQIGAAWAFNTDATNSSLAGGLAISGSTNENIILGTAGAATTLSNGNVTITVSFTTYGEDVAAPGTDGVYTVTASIPVSQMSIVGGDVVITEQAYNQAIKSAINTDNALSQVLEAMDGPGNTLVVYTKIDGTFVGTELGLEITNYQFNGSTLLAPADPTPAGYDDTLGAGDVLFQNYGTVSTAESDNIINVSADGEADVFVLSTNDTGTDLVTPNTAFDDANTDLDGTSNEELNFADGTFGSETIFNFDEGAAARNNGFDVMDFLHIEYDGTQFSNGVFLVTDDSISIVAETTGNDEVSEIATAYAGLVAGEEAIAIVFDETDDNRGTVYDINGVGTVADNANVTVVGDIELIGADWDTLTADNFA